jgi:histidinol-phosphatase (PHP family)
MSLSKLSDYHMHTPLCRHATGTAAEYVAAARDAGLAEIGFSDHSPMPEYFDSWRMLDEELPQYFDWIAEARHSAGNMPVRMGLEVDWIEGGEGWIENLAARAPWDYLIGSVHYIGAWNFDNPAEKQRFTDFGAEEAWNRYWALFANAARSGFFDIMGHPDLIKKFGHRPPDDLRRYYEPAVAAVAESGAAIEINTAGLYKDVEEIYPAPDFLRMACEAGVPLTINSDAHAPEEVGRAFWGAVMLAKSAGYTEIARFENRQRTMVPLP